MFHIRRYRAIKGVSYDFTCNTFRRGHSYFFFFFFCHAPFFENGCVLFYFNSYFKKFLNIDMAALYWPQVDLCFIFAVIVL